MRHYDFFTDDLIGLSIHVVHGADSTLLDNLPSDYAGYRPPKKDPNCYENVTPWKYNTTRSLKCHHPIYGNYIYIYLRDQYSRLELCEVEVYTANDQTVIPTPSFESEWFDYRQYYLLSDKTVAHGLGTLPIYGRLLLYSKSDPDRYIYEFQYFQEYHKHSMGKAFLLLYSDTSFWVIGEEDAFICLNAWSKAFQANGCYGDVMFKVQLWTQCAFPNPSYMSNWRDYSPGTITVYHELGKVPMFGHVQATYRGTSGALHTIQVREITVIYIVP